MRPYYFPLVVNNQQSVNPDTTSNPRRGVGMPLFHVVPGDAMTINVDWWYDWTCSEKYLSIPRYVPMSWSGSNALPLRKDYDGYLLSGNEPDLPEQGNETPENAARKVKLLAEKYPQAKLIVGGCSHWGSEWLPKFIQELGDYQPAGYHVHAYVDFGVKLAFLKDWWFPNVLRLCKGEIWLTEFADTTGGGCEKELLDYVKEQKRFTRYAWFASRLDGTEWYYPKQWSNPALIDSDGNLTRMGILYVAHHPGSVD